MVDLMMKVRYQMANGPYFETGNAPYKECSNPKLPAPFYLIYFFDLQIQISNSLHEWIKQSMQNESVRVAIKVFIYVPINFK